MAWQAPVFDRTAADVAAGADKCYFSAELLNRIEGNIEYLAKLFGVPVVAHTWAATDFLTLAQVQRILEGLAAVRDAYYAMPGSPNIPAPPATMWSDVNDIEKILWGIKELWDRNTARLKIYAGEAYAGDEMGVI